MSLWSHCEKHAFHYHCSAKVLAIVQCSGCFQHLYYCYLFWWLCFVFFVFNLVFFLPCISSSFVPCISSLRLHVLILRDFSCGPQILVLLICEFVCSVWGWFQYVYTIITTCKLLMMLSTIQPDQLVSISLSLYCQLAYIFSPWKLYDRVSMSWDCPENKEREFVYEK